MRISISSKGIEVTPALRARVEKKASKLQRYFDEDTQTAVRLSMERSRSIAEITVTLRGGDILRSEISAYDMYEAIDEACQKLERQIHRHAKRLEKRLNMGAFKSDVPEFSDEAYISASEPELVRRKTFPVKPMSIEDAIAQMQLLGHSFFAFVNDETERVCVVYTRNDGNFGLLEPEA